MKIGMLGGGQLGRMLILAGYPLGFSFRVFDERFSESAGAVAPQSVGRYDDIDALREFADGLDVITYEWENVPVAAATFLSSLCPVYPPPLALEQSQDRLTEKRFFHRVGIPTAPFVAVETRDDLDAAVQQTGLPAVLKTRRLGYDGKGQVVIQTPADVETAWATLGGSPLLLEGFVAFEREVSILAVRSRSGQMWCYPLVENAHADGMLRCSQAPAPHITPALQQQAESYAQRVGDALQYVGVLAIEFFYVVAQGSQTSTTLIANEMAPRVHNSGHWTIEGAETSQFANHIRAIAGLPLGSTRPVGYSTMLNCIGTMPDRSAILAVPGSHVHDYGKSARAGRKLGHVTVRGDDRTAVANAVESIEYLFKKTNP
ncbi:MAG: 5-(carboxyamino)imidazole ribonucleotide synthase [Chloroflexaceae bacterium]|nr:5-(carboxyamino)imidazole ribonucleotide synthase [Chloroflexaceae bacterium]